MYDLGKNCRKFLPIDDFIIEHCKDFLSLDRNKAKVTIGHRCRFGDCMSECLMFEVNVLIRLVLN